jgi:hypothetical protein
MDRLMKVQEVILTAANRILWWQGGDYRQIQTGSVCNAIDQNSKTQPN